MQVDYILVSLVIGIIIVAVAVIVGLLIISRRRAGTYVEPDYRAIYRLGLILTPTGVVITILYILFLGIQSIAIGSPLVVLGIIYLIIGLQNKAKWKK